MLRTRGRLSQDKKGAWKKTISFTILMFLLLGLLAIGPSHVSRQQYRYPGGLKPVEPQKTPIEQVLDALASNPVTGGIVRSLGYNPPPPPGEEPIGIGAEFGYTSVSGESIVFQEQLSGVGMIGMAGIYVKLGCLDFSVYETGDFEMTVDKNVTVAPIMDVMLGSEGGMEGWQKIVETATITVTAPYTSYVTTYITTAPEAK